MVKINIRQATNKNDFEFIRLLRTDARTIKGFIEQVEITEEQQIKYMSKYSSCYWIAETLEGLPLGFGGVIDNDIRFCVVPYYQNLGVGTKILEFLKNKYPNACGKIKKDNMSSITVFNIVGIPYKII